MPAADFQFVECDTCRAKPGSPALCAGCLANRDTISKLNALVRELAVTKALNDRLLTSTVPLDAHMPSATPEPVRYVPLSADSFDAAGTWVRDTPAPSSSEPEPGFGAVCPMCDKPALRLKFDGRMVSWVCTECETVSANLVVTQINKALGSAIRGGPSYGGVEVLHNGNVIDGLPAFSKLEPGTYSLYRVDSHGDAK